MRLIETFRLYAESAKRNNSALAVVLFDIDFFKNINDKHGHPVGDASLQYVAKFIKDRIRKTDLFARFGGEEFALLVAGANQEHCFNHVNSIRQQLSNLPFVYGELTIPITFSSGISMFGIDGENFDELLSNADQRLYIAKDRGRNCVVAANYQTISEAAQVPLTSS
ncbi:GGDEF domain-containing protein [Paraglaciecola aquimarina]